ncbi:MAG: fumarylacetoacetate hydrolase family protein [Bradyrhizobiaceae bacterium]|nr:fumarylacetoacetate hydrolase family protein [Bradyrhizobiaceae bacterium]
MQLARVKDKSSGGLRAAVYLDGKLVVLEGEPEFADVATLLASGSAGLKKAEQFARRGLENGRALDAASFEYASPTTPAVFLGLGYNYKALTANEGLPENVHPELFAKLPGCAIGHEQPVLVPAVIDKVDYEAELAVVIGRTARRVKAAKALDYVGGYTACNELTAKILPRPKESGSVIIPLKAVDTFGPMGPTLITADEIKNPQNLTMVCRVNGEEKQRFPTSDMVHSVADVIEYITARITLNPGDVISTGTSIGIGIIKKPPEFLKPGDVMEVEIEGYPALRNRIEWESQPPAGQ